jgi:hypothetical protein
MAPSKYETHVLPYLDRIEKWVTEGATAKEVAKKLGVSYSSFRQYLDDGRKGVERYSALSEAFARAQEIPDDNVEAALYKRACGFEYDETTWEEKLTRDGVVVEVKKVVRKTVPPDPTSAMFWLTNRRPLVWKYKQTERPEEGDTETGVVLLPEIGGDG